MKWLNAKVVFTRRDGLEVVVPVWLMAAAVVVAAAALNA